MNFYFNKWQLNVLEVKGYQTRRMRQELWIKSSLSNSSMLEKEVGKALGFYWIRYAQILVITVLDFLIDHVLFLFKFIASLFAILYHLWMRLTYVFKLQNGHTKASIPYHTMHLITEDVIDWFGSFGSVLCETILAWVLCQLFVFSSSVQRKDVFFLIRVVQSKMGKLLVT